MNEELITNLFIIAFGSILITTFVTILYVMLYLKLKEYFCRNCETKQENPTLKN